MDENTEWTRITTEREGTELEVAAVPQLTGDGVAFVTRLAEEEA